MGSNPTERTSVLFYAGMAEQVDAPDLKSVEANPRAGSNPVSRTNPQRANVEVKIDARLTDLKVIICGCRITAIMAAFQAADGGPTPLTRSTNTDWADTLTPKSARSLRRKC